MPGAWQTIPTFAAGFEDNEVVISGLTESTDYDVQFSTDSAFSESDTAVAQFRTLPAELLDRSLDFVIVNGIDLSDEWDFTNRTHTHTVNIDTLSGDILVTAGAADPRAVVSVSDNGVATDVTQGSTQTWTITVELGGGTETWTLTTNVKSPPTVKELTLGNVRIWDLYCTATHLWVRLGSQMRAYDLFTPDLSEDTSLRFTISGYSQTAFRGGMCFAHGYWWFGIGGNIGASSQGRVQRYTTSGSQSGQPSYAVPGAFGSLMQVVNRNDELWVIRDPGAGLVLQKLNSNATASGSPVTLPDPTGTTWNTHIFGADASGDDFMIGTNQGQILFVGLDGSVTRAVSRGAFQDNFAHAPGTSSAFAASRPSQGGSSPIRVFEWQADDDTSHAHISNISFTHITASSATATVFLRDADAFRLYLRYRFISSPTSQLVGSWRTPDAHAVTPGLFFYPFSITGLQFQSVYEVQADTDPQFGNPVTRTLNTDALVVVAPPPPPPDPVVTPPTTDPERVPEPPDTPTGLSVDTGPTVAEVSWNASDGADSYTLQTRKTGESDWTTRGNITATSFRVTGLDASTSYQFRVRAENSDGDSDYSSVVTESTTAAGTTEPEVIVTPDPPPTPTRLRVTGVTSSGFTARWNSAARAARYDLQRRVGISGSWRQFSGLTSLLRVFTGLPSGTTYQVRVRAVGEGGTSSWSSAVSVTTSGTAPEPEPDPDPTTATTAPDAPTGLAGNASADSVSLAWNRSEATRTYEVEYRTVLASDWTSISNIFATRRSVTGLEASTSYVFRVRAVNHIGPSDWSAPISVRTLRASTVVTPPTTVTYRVSAVADDTGTVNVSVSSSAPDGSAVQVTLVGLATRIGILRSGAATATFPNVSAGTYTVSVTVDGSQVASTSVTVPEQPDPPAGSFTVKVSVRPLTLSAGIDWVMNTRDADSWQVVMQIAGTQDYSNSGTVPSSGIVRDGFSRSGPSGVVETVTVVLTGPGGTVRKTERVDLGPRLGTASASFAIP